MNDGITYGEMLALMGGHAPPADPTQRAAYFRLFEIRAAAQLGQERFDALALLAGSMPPEYAEFDRARCEENARRLREESANGTK